MLVLRELNDVVGKVAQLQVGEAVVPEVFKQPRAAAGRLVADGRAANAHADRRNAGAD